MNYAGFVILLSLLAVFALYTPVTNAIACYHCTSLADGKCDDPFNVEEHGKHDNCSVCWKLKGESPYYQKTLIERGCDETGDEPNSGCHDRTQDGIAGTVCFCNKDLCNGGPSTVFSTTQVLPMAMCLFLSVVRVIAIR